MTYRPEHRGGVLPSRRAPGTRRLHRRRVPASAACGSLALLLTLTAPFPAAGAPAVDRRVTGSATADGRPLAGVEVRLLPMAALTGAPSAGGGAGAEPLATDRTEGDGAFSLTVPHPGPWGIRAVAAGRVGREIVVEVLDDPLSLPPVELPRARELEVRLTGPGGGPAGGAVAWPAGAPVASLPVDRWRPTPVAASAGDDGIALLPVPATGEVEIQGVAPGFAPARTPAAGPVAVVAFAPAVAVEVEIVHAAGHALPGVQVFSRGGPLPVAEAGPEGRAKLALAAGSDGRPLPLTLIATDGSIARARLPGSGDGAARRLRFRAPRTVSGRVVERGTGLPLAGAHAWVRPPRPGAVGRTHTDGTFELRLSGDAPFAVAAAADDHRWGDSAPASGERRVEIALAARRRAVVRVVDQDGRPVEGAEALLTPVPSEHGGKPLGPFRSRSDGFFEVPNPPAGRFDLAVEAAGFGPVTVPGVVVPKSPDKIDLGVVTLSAGVELAGRVVDADGNPLEGARVLLAAAGPIPWDWILTTEGLADEHWTGAGGDFAFPDLAPGSRVRLRAWKEGFVASETPALDLPTHGPVDVVLARPATLSGWVVDGAGRAIPRALVTVEGAPAGGGASAAAAWTSRDGHFELRSVRPGRQVLRASAAGYRDGRSRPVAAEPGEEVPAVEIVLREGVAVRGLVVDAGGAPAAGATVEAADARGGTAAFARTDREGRFLFSGLAPAPHTVVAVGGDGREAQRRVDLASGSRDVTLVLEGGVPILGRVVGIDGSPVADARVVLERVSGAGGTVGTRTDPLGRFGWESLPPGAYHLFASAEGLSPSRGVVVTVEDRPVDDLEVVLDPGLTVRGQVHGVLFDRLPHVTIRALGIPGPPARVDHTGRFVLRHLPAGEVVLVVELTGTGRRAVERIELPAGAPEVEASLWLPGTPGSR